MALPHHNHIVITLRVPYVLDYKLLSLIHKFEAVHVSPNIRIGEDFVGFSI